MAIPSPQYEISLPIVPFHAIRDSIHATNQPFTLAPTMQRNTLKTFHRFPNLPPELRYRVWNFILDLRHPRFLPLEPTTCDVPVALHVCKESRTEGLRRYQLLKSKVGGKMTRNFRFWVDYERDVLCINKGLDLFDTAKIRYDRPTPICGASCIYRDWLEPVKILAIDFYLLNFLRPTRDGSRFFKSLNELCPRLQELHVIVSKDLQKTGPVVWMTSGSYKQFNLGSPGDRTLSSEDRILATIGLLLRAELRKAQEEKGHCKALKLEWKEVDPIVGLMVAMRERAGEVKTEKK